MAKTYRSKFEATLAALPALTGAEYETVGLVYRLPPAVYTPDFQLPNGILLEAKGFFKAADRTKMKLVRAQHPHVDLRVVLQTPYKTLSPASMTTYAGWCEQHGFPWCAGKDHDTLTAWAKEYQHV